ncbi:MAG: ung [Bacteriovoracaceae bacterium]|nr:ung [Bacteriovoracaceae bacterium]
MSTASAHTEDVQSNNRQFPHNLPIGWQKLLEKDVDEPYFKSLTKFLKSEYLAKKTIYPPAERILKALQLVDFDEVKVVILGQDPYHGKNQAVGLCFSVPNETFPKPPSLQNIYKEISSDIGVPMNPKVSNLTGWAHQGVLLLNTVLTVEAGKAFSHRNQGWEIFTDKIIRFLSAREKPIVFLLWGAAAQKKVDLIDTQKHFVLKAAHPSPLSAHAGFFGCKHFSKTNTILKEKLKSSPIDWQKII